MPGWQITFIAVGAAFLAAAVPVLAHRSLAARDARPPAPPESETQTGASGHRQWPGASPHAIANLGALG